MTLADTLAQLAVANRNPSWLEYKHSSPAEQRAIVARWKEIASAPAGSFDDISDYAKVNFKIALAFHGAAEWPERKSAHMPETFRAKDDVQWDYDMCGSRQNSEYGE